MNTIIDGRSIVMVFLDPKSVLHIFVDANFPYCRLTWKALQPYMKAGLQVRWIPVATLGPTSMPKAVEVLGAKDKTAAFQKREENAGKGWSQAPGFTEADRPEIVAAIQKNNELMSAFGIGGTPEIPAMTGLPDQKVSDPALARFR